MASAKRIAARLEQIKTQASNLNAQPKSKGAGDLAEEAAGLGLELYELMKAVK